MVKDFCLDGLEYTDSSGVVTFYALDSSKELKMYTASVPGAVPQEVLNRVFKERGRHQSHYHSQWDNCDDHCC
ncbi:MAG: hypothetical protein Pg6A_19900 [Termitinemataceae bacterium]|nr:MAG: hypothetical protein Pg6A_19900 [Termitinemataceae bacterium]